MIGLEEAKRRLQRAYLSSADEFLGIAEEILKHAEKNLAVADRSVRAAEKYASLLELDTTEARRKASLAVRRRNRQVAEETLRHSLMIDLANRRTRSLFKLLHRRTGRLEKSRASLALALERARKDLDEWEKYGELKHLADLSLQLRALSEGSLRTLTHIERVVASLEMAKVSREQLESLRSQVASVEGTYAWPARLRGKPLRTINQIVERELRRMAREEERAHPKA